MLQVTPPLYSVPGYRLAKGLPIQVYQGISMQLNHMLQQLDRGLEAQETPGYYADLVLNFLKGLGNSQYKDIEFSPLSQHEFMGQALPTTQIYINIQAPEDRTHMINSRSLDRLSFYEMLIQAMSGFLQYSGAGNTDIFPTQFLITNLYEWYIFPPATLNSLLEQSPDLLEYFKGYKADKPAYRSVESLYRLIDQSHEQFPITGTYFNLYGIKEGLGQFDTVIQERIIPLCHLLASWFEGEESPDTSPLLLEKELAHLMGLEKVHRSDLPFYRFPKKSSDSLLEETSQLQRRRGLFFIHRALLQHYIGNEGLIQLEKNGTLNKEERTFEPSKKGIYPYPATECPDVEAQKIIPPSSYWERIQKAQNLSPHFHMGLTENGYEPLNAGTWTSIWLALNREKSTEPHLPPRSLAPWIQDSLIELILQTFNKKKKWKCRDWAELKRKVGDLSLDETKGILLSIKICDPAAGMGQMLLLILNELCSLFVELGYLTDSAGQRLLGIHFKRIGWATHPLDSQGNLIEYPPHTLTDTEGSFARNIHKGIFHVKWDIIHSCLYGICPSSYLGQVAKQVLLLSLLSNRYQFKGKQTLKWVSLASFSPNIYIGNPLLSIRPIQAYIGDQKRTSLIPNDPRKERLMELRGKLQQLQQPLSLWDSPTENKKEGKDWDFQQVSEAIQTLESQIQDTEDFWGMYLEWKDLFPFLWTERGEFVGFDAVFSTPPSIRQDEFQAFNPYLKHTFAGFRSQANFYMYLMEVGIRLLRPGGRYGFLSPDKWQSVQYGDRFRKWIAEQSIYKHLRLSDGNSKQKGQLRHPLWTSGIRKFPVDKIGS